MRMINSMDRTKDAAGVKEVWGKEKSSKCKKCQSDLFIADEENIDGGFQDDGDEGGEQPGDSFQGQCQT